MYVPPVLSRLSTNAPCYSEVTLCVQPAPRSPSTFTLQTLQSMGQQQAPLTRSSQTWGLLSPVCTKMALLSTHSSHAPCSKACPSSPKLLYSASQPAHGAHLSPVWMYWKMAPSAVAQITHQFQTMPQRFTTPHITASSLLPQGVACNQAGSSLVARVDVLEDSALSSHSASLLASAGQALLAQPVPSLLGIVIARCQSLPQQQTQRFGWERRGG